MKRNALKSTLCTCLIVLSCMSCVNRIGDNDIQEGTVPISFSTKISKSTTKTTTSAFEKGERIGLFAVLTPATIDGQRYIDNLCLECGEDRILIPEKEVFYPEGDATLDFISYYPYQQEGISQGNTLLPISVQTDQSISNNHSTSDFLIARTTEIKSGNQPVELAYKHQLAKIKIILSPKTGENADDMLQANPKIIATGFNTQALYDLQSGNISGLTAKNDISPFGRWKKQSNGTLSGIEFIVIPQKDDTGEQAFVLEWNGKLYTCPMPAVTMKGNTEFEICIDALQTTSHLLSSIAGNIEPWEYQENGESENNHNLTSVRIAALSFSTSDVYRVYHQSIPIAEICKEYLHSTNSNITSRAIVVYPVKDEKTDLQKGRVLQLLDMTGAVHNGSINWDTENNSLNYTPGNSEPIENFYIDENGEITLEKPQVPAAINVSSYRIRDIRNGVLQTYPIVKIGTQYWMKEDLQATCFRDKTPLAFKTILGTGAGYFQDDKKTLFFYNGEALLMEELAPLNWKIPNKNDWDKLIKYVNSSASSLKSGTWKTFSTEELSPVTNLSGLSILPNGLYTEGKDTGKPLHGNTGTTAVYWINGETKGTLAENGILFMGNTDLITFGSNKVKDKDYYQAFSIRCIKE